MRCTDATAPPANILAPREAGQDRLYISEASRPCFGHSILLVVSPQCNGRQVTGLFRRVKVSFGFDTLLLVVKCRQKAFFGHDEVFSVSGAQPDTGISRRVKASSGLNMLDEVQGAQSVTGRFRRVKASFGLDMLDPV